MIPRPARGAGISGHRLLLRIQAVADSGAADRGFRLPAAVHQPARGCRGGRHGSPAVIPDDDTPAVTVHPHAQTLLKGPRKGVFFERRPGVTLPPIHTRRRDASQAQRAPRISRANLRVIRYRAGRSRGRLYQVGTGVATDLLPEAGNAPTATCSSPCWLTSWCR